MKKYDCSISKDLIHELNRMCSNIKNCCECPLNNPFYHCSMEANKISNDVITIVQKWSDENPEKPKLRQVEYSFVKMFHPYEFPCYTIHRNNDGNLFVSEGKKDLKLNPYEFSFIKNGEHWSLEELLELEVEDD